MYNRVLPRDLFNESKLLKCLGQLSLIIHDGRDSKGNQVRWPLRWVHTLKEHGFMIEQNAADGGLYCSNLTLCVQMLVVKLRTVYNSKDPFPLLFIDYDDTEGNVFNDDGSLSQEFMSWLDERCR